MAHWWSFRAELQLFSISLKSHQYLKVIQSLVLDQSYHSTALTIGMAVNESISVFGSLYYGGNLE